MNQKHLMKMIAPIAITAVILLYFFAFIAFGFYSHISGIFRIFAFMAPIAMMGACVYVLVERIREIRSGEEDDLNKY